jgi:hypothetical protein
MSDTAIYFQRKHLWVTIPANEREEISSLLFELVQTGDIVLYNVHDYAKCAGRECIIHSPSQRESDVLPLLWRPDRGIFERICPHGVGHPDKAQRDYWLSTDQDYQFVHGCDGCCRL